jgi:ribosomal protein S18 acetylase RimI-like enzyme
MTEPLNRRVSAPEVAERPVDGEGIAWRAATADDIDAILDLEAAVGAADHPRYVSSREDIAENFERSHIDPQRDTIVATEDGELVAWGVAELGAGQDTLVNVHLFGGVRPSHRGRGLGRRLLSWQEARGLQQLASSDKALPGWLSIYLDDQAASARGLVERRGYAPARWFLELTRDLGEPVGMRPVAEGVRVVPYTEDLWEATRAARNDSFRDHWGSQSVNEERWLAFSRRKGSRPQWCSIALGQDENGGWDVVAFVIAHANEHDWPLQGFTSAYVDLVGTRRDWRGRGLASALLTATLRAVAADGIQKVLLDVDSDSPTGALGLYTGLGFTETARTVSYTKVY